MCGSEVEKDEGKKIVQEHSLLMCHGHLLPVVVEIAMCGSEVKRKMKMKAAQ